MREAGRLLVAGFLVVSSAAAEARPLLIVHDDEARLATLDVESGAVRLIGAMRVQLLDIASAFEGRVYGVGDDTLFEIDSKTGSVTPVGPLLAGNVNALAVRADGVIFAAGSEGGGSLYQIDPISGAAEAVGPIGFSPSGDLEFDDRGTLYLSTTSDELVKVDTATGAGALVGPLGHEVFGLAFADDGIMYGLSGTQLLIVDLRTGQATPIFDYRDSGLGLAYGAAFSMVSEQLPPRPVIYVHDDSGRLGSVDLEGGTIRLVGKMSEDLTDIASDIDGTIYGITRSRLYRVNAEDAGLTLIGELDVDDQMVALVVGPDGLLYGGGGAGSGQLYSIDKSTGRASLVGSIGFRPDGDLAFDDAGWLYMSSSTDRLIRIDVASGRGTSIGSLGFSDVLGLAFGADGVLYGFSSTRVLAINLNTGAANLVLDYRGRGFGQAYGASLPPLPPAKRPLIFVPGILGTSLCGNANLFSEPENCRGLTQYWPALSNCDITALRPGPNGIPPRGRPGEVIERLAPFDPFGLGNVYGETLNFLHEATAATHVVIPFPYDWRRDLRATATLLGATISRALDDTRADRVDIVAHSMGGLLVKALLSQRNSAGEKRNERLVRRLIFVGTPHFGTPQAIRGVLDGLPLFGLGVSILSKFERPLSFNKEEVLGYVARNSPASYQLLPSAALLEQHGASLAVRESAATLINSGTFDTTVAAFLNFIDRPVDGQDEFQERLGADEWRHVRCSFCSSGPDLCFAMDEPLNDDGLSRWMRAHESYQAGGNAWDLWEPDPEAGLEAFAIYGVQPGVRTISRIAIDSRQGKGAIVDVRRGRGDGTVAEESGGAFGVPYFEDRRFQFPYEHLKLIQSAGVSQCIVGLLAPTPVSCPVGSQLSTGVVAQDLELQLGGPAELLVEDGAGNRTGVTDDGAELKEIPNSVFERLTSSSLIMVPFEGEQRIVVTARNAGLVRLRLHVLDEEQVLRELYYEAELLATGQLVVVISPELDSLKADVDVDGDGSPETTRTPLDLPVADPGLSQFVKSGEQVFLDGGRSVSPFGREIEYTWAQIEGPAVSLSSANSTVARFQAPETVEAVSLVFGLQVRSGGVASRIATTSVIVRECGPELCNGVDDDCDGLVDDEDPEGGASCATGLLEPCGEGVTRCSDGVLGCFPVDEFCIAEAGCEGDFDCDDGDFCNGTEVCFRETCLPGEPPCLGVCQLCDATEDQCVLRPDCVVSMGCDVVEASPPKLDVGSLSRDFGDISVGGRAESSITVTNAGCGVLEVEVDEDCVDFEITPSEFQLADGAAVSVDVFFVPVAAGLSNCLVTVLSSGGEAEGILRGFGLLEVTPTPTGQFTPTITLPVREAGDANCDGMIDAADLVALVSLVSGRTEPGCVGPDADCDGIIGSTDVRSVIERIFASRMGCRRGDREIVRGHD